MYKCSRCGREFDRTVEYAGHAAQCGVGKTNCGICGRRISRSVLHLHIAAHEKDHPCLFCGKTVGGEKKFCDHSCAAAHTNKGRRRKDVPTPACVECGKTAKTHNQRFCSRECFQSNRWKKIKSKIEENGEFSQREHTGGAPNRYVLELRGNVCWVCGNKEWMGSPIPLVLDHVDGDATNWRVDNLRLVCGNCSMQLPTFAGRNRGKGRRSRRERDRETARNKRAGVA